MNQLFTDAETLSKTRPTGITEAQEQAFYREAAQQIVKNGWSRDAIEDIMEDLAELSFSDSGYEMAKDLESYSRHATYQIDSFFISFLEDLDHEKDQILWNNVKAWVKARNPQPLLNKGAKVILQKALGYQMKQGATFYITGLSEDVGSYLISQDPNKNGGYVIAYERLEDCLTPVQP